LLVGATAREQDRQVKRLKQFIAAEEEPQEDFSFPTLGNLHRTLESVEEAESKLNLDNDKINAALFWFWNGNPITDEAAFDALKDKDIDTAIEIWRKLVYDSEEEYNEVTKRNASAFHNLSTLYLSEYGIDEDTLQLKLSFLESDFVKGFKASVADETYKTTKKKLQLLFIENLLNEESLDLSEFLEAISDINFSAKADFLKGFVQKIIELIEQKIETTKNKRKSSKPNAAKAGQELFAETANDLLQLKNIIGTSDMRYTSTADKVANEILQCSIDYFNDSQEKDSSSDYAETAMKLAKQAEMLAVGNLTKERIKDNISTLAEMKDRELSQAIAVLKSIKQAYEEACRQIDKQVNELRYEAIGDYRLPKPNVSINWSKVKDMKRNCLAWDKVTEVICEAIPQQNIKKIKTASNSFKLNEYKYLVDFLLVKISNLYRNRITYLRYWVEPSTTSSSTSTSKPTTNAPSTPKPATQNTSKKEEEEEKKREENILLVIAIIIWFLIFVFADNKIETTSEIILYLAFFFFAMWYAPMILIKKTIQFFKKN